MLTGVAGAVVAVALVTAVIYPLKHVAPVVSLGVVYLLAVLVISTYWGALLGVATSFVSAAAFNFFHLPPVGRFTLADSRNWVALGAFLTVSIAASTVAEAARNRAIDAENGRREADLAADMARILLGEARLSDALPLTARRLAEAIGADSASIEPGVCERERQRAIALSDGSERIGTLLVPLDLSPRQMERLCGRIVPPLESILTAALVRERLHDEVIETSSLRRSDEMKTALLRSVSHDLRTPVTAILAGASALPMTSAEGNERQAVEQGIAQAATRLSGLIDKLLDLSRLQAGTAEPRREWCSVEEILREAAEHVDGGPALFRFAIAPGLPLVRADAIQLERAFANVLENAVRYAGDETVSVRARALGDRLLVRIVDRGPGIASGEQERIFLPFYRAPGAPAGERGSGLGLAIAQGFVEANGGRISVESLPGQGTSFVFMLPLEPEARPSAEPLPQVALP